MIDPDLIYRNDGDSEGFSLVSDEGEVIYNKTISLDLSPGRQALLQEVEEVLEQRRQSGTESQRSVVQRRNSDGI